MRLERFVELEAASGSAVAFADGIWWQRVKPFYSWPVDLFAAFQPGRRPPLSFRAVGYEHAVPDPAQERGRLPLMVLEDAAGYGLGRLPAKKRNQVRRGLERVEVRRIEDVRELVERGLDINRSALGRQGWGGDRSGYVDADLWRRNLERQHRLGTRESWGAYADGRLVAYLRAYALEDTVYISQAMSDTAFLRDYPNDALLHIFLMDCGSRPGIRRVVFGLECDKQSLNEYKMRFGFRPVGIAVYRWINPVVRVIVPWTRYRHYLR